MSDSFLILLAILATGIPLGIQGVCVRLERWGYRKDPRYKDHPELKGVRKGDRLLYANFPCKRESSDTNTL